MALNPRKLPTSPTWDGDWDALPGTLDTRHMAAILGVTLDTVWRRIEQRRIEVNPIRWVPPYRWLRNTVKKQLEGVR